MNEKDLIENNVCCSMSEARRLLKNMKTSKKLKSKLQQLCKKSKTSIEDETNDNRK